jgi:hypothetical protein
MHQLIITGQGAINHNGIEYPVYDFLRLITGEYPVKRDNAFVYNLNQFAMGGDKKQESEDAYVESIRSKLGGRATVEVVDYVEPKPVEEPPPDVKH